MEFAVPIVRRLDRPRASRSRSLFPAVLTARNTCMRYSELRLLRWRQVDLNSCTLTVGNSKTESGTGRLLPLNDRAVAIFGFWASLFPEREPSHFVFPAERYGASGEGRAVVYESDPTKPIGRMSRRYGHIGQAAQRQAVNALRAAGTDADRAQNWAQSQKSRTRQLSN